MIAAAKMLAGLKEGDARPAWWKWGIVMTASIAAMMEVIDTSIVNVALPHMQGNLGATLTEIGWVITAYAMANVIMIPLSAWMGHYFGKKNYFIFCLAGFTAASALCGMATSLPVLVVSRVLQGLMGGGLLAKAQAILFETFEKHEQARAQAIFGLGIIAGPAIGPTLGGYITDAIGWRWIFYINIPIGIVAVMATMLFFYKDELDPNRNMSVDWFGIFLLALGLGAFQVMLEEGQQHDWFSSPFILTMAITSLVSLTLFVWQELTTAHPAVDLRVLKYGSVAAGSVFSAILGMGLFGTVFVVPVFAQNILNFTATKTGEMLIPGALTSAAFMIIMGQLMPRFDARKIICAGCILTAIPMFMLATINTNTGFDALYWPLILRGAGTVMMYLPLTLATLGSVAKKDVASASGFFNLTRQIGGSVGIAILATALSRRENFHRARLVENINLYSPQLHERLSAMTAGMVHAGSSLTVAKQQAWAMLDHMIGLQASILSFADLFFVVGIIFIASLLLVFFLGKGNAANAPAPGAH